MYKFCYPPLLNKEIIKETRFDQIRRKKLLKNFLSAKEENVKIIQDNLARCFHVVASKSRRRACTIRDGMAAITRQDSLKKLLASKKLIVKPRDRTPSWCEKSWRKIDRSLNSHSTKQYSDKSEQPMQSHR